MASAMVAGSMITMVSRRAVPTAVAIAVTVVPIPVAFLLSAFLLLCQRFLEIFERHVVGMLL